MPSAREIVKKLAPNEGFCPKRRAYFKLGLSTHQTGSKFSGSFVVSFLQRDFSLRLQGDPKILIPSIEDSKIGEE